MTSASLHRLLFVFAAVSVVGPLRASESFAGVELQHDRGEGKVRVMIRGDHFTTYHYGEEARTPFLWPVRAEGGVGITRNYPMGTDDPESTDHEHHRSLSLTFGDVNGYDHWHRERIATRSIETGSSGDYSWIRAHNEWLTPEGEPLLKEVQELRFYDAPPAGRYFDIISTLVAGSRGVTFGDYKEGLMAFRVRPEIQGNRGGVLSNAAGRQGEKAVYGRRSAWMDYSGPVKGHGVRGIALFDHPGNFRYPTFWHVRDYGLAAANPFGMRSVAGMKQDGSHRLKKDHSLTFVYRFYIHSGDVQEAKVAEKYQEFAEKAYSRN